MIIISARKNFWDDNRLSSEKDKIREVDLIGDKPSKKISKEDLKAKINGQRVLVIIHGYNNEFEEVESAYATIEKNASKYLSDHYDLIVGYTWPGGDDPMDYFAAKRRANSMGRRVGLFFKFMTEHSAKFDVMCHSMGVRVTLKGLKSQSSKCANFIFSMAGAVDNECLEKGEEFYNASKNCTAFVVMHSRYDKTLKLAYRLAHLDRAIGLSGPENPDEIIKYSSPSNPTPPNVYVLNAKKEIKRHGGYKSSKKIFQYIDKFNKNAPAVSQFSTL